jgi:Putative restriction endonuclease
MPTMYDLPSEDPEEPGLPDEFHDFQPKLLRETFQSPTYPHSEVFIGTNINLYYDGRQPLWHNRPDWFLALGVKPGNKQEDLRWSYVVWQESVSPFLVVELLSPGKGNWIPSEVEARQIAETARQAASVAQKTAEAARQTAEAQVETERSARRAAIPRLKSLGLTPEQIAEALGLSIAEID